MSDKKEKKMKSYHITFDAWNIFEDEDGSYAPDISPEEKIDNLINEEYGTNCALASYAGKVIEKNMPYLMIREYGVTGKEHYHMYFHSTMCKNTIKKKLDELIRTTIYFSNPSNPKYRKYETDGVLGVEIYLCKGETNHMKINDDLKVIPYVILSNTSYYGNWEDTTSRIRFIRQKYEEQIEKMKKYKKSVADISAERKKSEWEEILKEITAQPLHSSSDIKDYLSYQHYTKEKYNFTENGAKNLYRKILKKIDINQYKNLIRNKFDLICD